MPLLPRLPWELEPSSRLGHTGHACRAQLGGSVLVLLWLGGVAIRHE